MATIEHLLNGYSKPDGDSDLRESTEFSDISDGIDVLTSESNSIPEEYKKGTGTISSFFIVVISGGELRESIYLQELSKKRTFPRVKLIFVSSDRNKGGLPPKEMVEKLYDTVEFDEPTKSHKILYSSIDKIFMVSDVDHYYDDLVAILSKHDNPNIIWIISNPCFEIWLYYAYYDYLRDEIRVLESLPQPKQSSKLKTLNDTVVKGGIDPRKAFERINIATDNSKKYYKVDSNGIPELYCTNMHILGDYLLEAIGAQEFEKWLEAKQNKVKSYTKKVI